MNNKVLGYSGEAQALQFLKAKKYKIIKTNFVCSIGEADIIAQDNDTIVFIEVKTRESDKYGLPCEAVTPFKQNKYRQLAIYYLKNNNLLGMAVRFDVIEILAGKLNHIENAFE